jgi:hypothetical protein
MLLEVAMLESEEGVPPLAESMHALTGWGSFRFFSPWHKALQVIIVNS